MEAILTRAYMHGGKVFGGYVRDTLLLGLPSPDLDFWFTEMVPAQMFMHALYYSHGYRCFQHPSTPAYATAIFFLRSSEPGHPPLDVVISPRFPGGVSPVNLLTFDGTSLTSHAPEDTAGTNPGLPAILALIRARTMPLYPEYQARCESEPDIRAKIADKRERGWTITDYTE